MMEVVPCGDPIHLFVTRGILWIPHVEKTEFFSPQFLIQSYLN